MLFRSGSATYLFVLTPLVVFVTRSWDEEHAHIILLSLALFYAWKFLILSFRAGLRESLVASRALASPEDAWDQVLGWFILAPWAAQVLMGRSSGLLVALALFLVWQRLILPFRAGLAESGGWQSMPGRQLG